MGAKKKKGGKKKKKKGGGEFGVGADEEQYFNQAMKEALEAKYIRESEAADRSTGGANERRKRELEMEKMVMEEKRTMMDIIADMTRQFKSVEEQKTNEINYLHAQSDENEQTIKQLNSEVDELKEKKK